MHYLITCSAVNVVTSDIKILPKCWVILGGQFKTEN